MTTTREAAQELDVTEETISTLRDQIADEPDLYDSETLHITDAGMEVIRTQLRENTDRINEDLLSNVEDIADEYAKAQALADELLQRRDAAMRAAFTHGHNRKLIARLAGISRERLYQIL